MFELGKKKESEHRSIRFQFLLQFIRSTTGINLPSNNNQLAVPTFTADLTDQPEGPSAPSICTSLRWCI
jgi:hypothetical protein